MGKYFWDREEEDEGEDSAQKQENDNETLRQMISSAEPMIEQLDHLYNQYFSGFEKRAPMDQRNRLDAHMKKMEQHPKPTPSTKFQYNTIHAKYISYRDHWDKRLKELESSGSRGRF